MLFWPVVDTKAITNTNFLYTLPIAVLCVPMVIPTAVLCVPMVFAIAVLLAPLVFPIAVF